MKSCLHLTGLLCLLLLPLLGRAQEVRISGRVVDALTKEPLPSTSVSLLNAGVGSLTDEFGRFQLASSKPFQLDSVRIVNLAYENYTELINIDYGNELLFEIRRLNIKSTAKRDTVFVCHLSSQNPERNVEAEMLAGIPSHQYAFFISNETQKQFGKLRTISFYIGDKGLPMKPFRIRVYKADGNYYSPKTDLLNENVFAVPTYVNQWYTYNLKQYNIAVPEEGYFVALEFVRPDNILSQAVIENYVPTGIMMRPAIKLKKSIVWSYMPKSSWNICSKTNSLHRFDAMIKVEVNSVE